MDQHVANAGLSLQYRVADFVVRYLAASGVEFVFGVDGANIEDIYDAAHFCDGITALLAKHEFSAAAMADGYSRSCPGLGVVAATSGGGSLNLVPGLGESLASRVAVLALVGQPPMALDGQGSFQDMSGLNGSLDAEALFSTVSLYCRRITGPEEIVKTLPEAVEAANRGGPAVLLLPKDVQQARLSVGPHAVPPHRNGESPRGLEVDLDPALRMLDQTSGPVTIIAGEQVARDDARDELEHVRRTLRASVAAVPEAKDVVNAPGASALGVTGAMGHARVAEAVRSSGVCLVLGTRLPVTARTGLGEALSAVPTISMGSAPTYEPCTRHIHTQDLRDTLSRLGRALSRSRTPSVGARASRKRAGEKPTRPSHTGPGIRYSEAMAVLDSMLPDESDIVVDAGNCGASAIHYLPARPAGRFVVALGMGGMGYSFGAGIGMALGRRRRCVVIAGDGAFFMHGMEIHTTVEYRLPVTFVLFNNNAHAMCAIREQLFFGDRYSYNRFRPSRLGAGLAEMFPGLPSVDVREINELATALDSALKCDGPSVIGIECSPDEIPPYAPLLANATGAVAGPRGSAP
ncbi:acetolactate synthase [Mycobacterium sp. 852002-50816_SCH5313054-b]|uniref:thiamine pyrophosphate-binding protein n=1 Tax=Mycobacterium sp. 852002-50816_SCH5313054-b TaxID=1834092 RepID=UPI0007FC8D66|nr:thiamine pyrophosphate-binding protein [Mycobacterium sp. 852002-50816_SCH5313054-b]OBF55325.1 acetolactate synthase [Mycobacterium sp. 852002-50816_SCH5313054-b]